MSVLKNWEMRCPRCKSSEYIDIEATVSVRLTSDGTDADASSDGSHTWDDDSAASCANTAYRNGRVCGFDGQVKHFKVPA